MGNRIIWKCFNGNVGDPYRYRCSTMSDVAGHKEVMLGFCEDAFGPGTPLGIPDTSARWQSAFANILEMAQFGFRDEIDRLMFICRF